MFWRNKTNYPPAYYYCCYTKPESKHPLEYFIFLAAVVAAAATLCAAVIARDQEQRSLRAYLSVNGAGASHAINDSTNRIEGYGFFVRWQNTGQTPSYHTRIKNIISVSVKDTRVMFRNTEPFTESDISETTIGRDGIVTTQPLIVTIRTIKEAIDSGKTVNVYSIADYCDIFVGHHVERFAYVVDFNVDPTLPHEKIAEQFKFRAIFNYEVDDKEIEKEQADHCSHAQ